MIDKFIEAMNKAGLPPAKHSEIKETFGEFERYHTTDDKPKKSSGWYRLTIDGDFAYGQFGSHRHGVTHNWHSKAKKGMTEQEKKDFRERLEKERTHREAELAEKRAKAAKKAVRLLSNAQDALSDHPYLVRKAITPPATVKQSQGRLMVPVWNGQERVGIQYIDEQGDKLFLEDTNMKGSYFPIIGKKDPRHTFIVCEGVATGATIYEATGIPTVCAFNAGNLKPVCEWLRGKYSDSKIIIASDNDQWTVKPGHKGHDSSLPGDDKQWQLLRESDLLYNVGLDKAQQAAHAVGGYVIKPDFPEDSKDKPTDFNDYAAAFGKESVADVVDLMLERIEKAEQGQEEQQQTQSPANVAAPQDYQWLDHMVWANREEGKLDPKKPLYNAMQWLRVHPEWEGKFVYDEFKRMVWIASPLPWDRTEFFKPREINDRDLTRIKADLEYHGMIIPKTQVADAIEVASEANKQNPVLEYFERLEWDGKPRLNRWLIDLCGAKEQAEGYVEAVASKWMIAGVKRVYEPGTKFDHMLVLEGEQGVRKSTALKTLATFGNSEAETYFSDRFTFSQIEDKYAALHLLGHLIIEFQEMTGLTAKDRNKVKQWITQTHDEVRKPFAATTDKYPRMYILAGTTNDSHWMTDPTGNRRFWPVKVDRVDIKELEAQRDQLWAEAVARYKKGEQWYINDTDDIYVEAEAEQRMRYIGDAWDEIIEDGICGMIGDITTDKILRDVIHLPRERWTNRERSRIANVMRSMGYENKPKRIKGKVKRVWETL